MNQFYKLTLARTYDFRTGLLFKLGGEKGTRLIFGIENSKLLGRKDIIGTCTPANSSRILQKVIFESNLKKFGRNRVELWFMYYTNNKGTLLLASRANPVPTCGLAHPKLFISASDWCLGLLFLFFVKLTFVFWENGKKYKKYCIANLYLI